MKFIFLAVLALGLNSQALADLPCSAKNAIDNDEGFKKVFEYELLTANYSKALNTDYVANKVELDQLASHQLYAQLKDKSLLLPVKDGLDRIGFYEGRFDEAKLDKYFADSRNDDSCYAFATALYRVYCSDAQNQIKCQRQCVYSIVSGCTETGWP